MTDRDPALNARQATCPPPGAVPAAPLAAASPNAAASALLLRPTLGELAVLPTILPRRLAELVTVLATSARVSLRVAAFFVEAILESSEYTTRLGLGYVRRILVSAITSARRVYLSASDDANALLLLGAADESEPASQPAKGIAGLATDRFVQTLERYTNLGIYVIHHAFTMAELFAMSGFYLTAAAAKTAHHAALESVDVFDSIFGSNESSRTLSAIITLVRREVLEDPRFKEKDKGKVATLSALTKALTAFACLQNATWIRTAGKMKMKVLHDCTILTERDEASDSRTSVTAYDNLTYGPQAHEAAAGPGPSTIQQRRRQDSACAIDLGEPDRPLPGPASPPADIDEYLWELDDLVGESGDAVYDADAEPAQETRVAPLASAQTPRHRRRIRRVQNDVYEITDELSESTVVTRTLERVALTPTPAPTPGSATPAGAGASGGPGSWNMHARQRSAPLPAVVVEPLADDSDDSRLARRLSVSALTDDESEWIEVDHLLDDMDQGTDAAAVPSPIPSAPNGSPTALTSPTYRDAVEHPYGNAERIQLVLRTMTNRLLQRKRMVRRMPSFSSSSSTPTATSRDASTTRGRFEHGQASQASSAATSATSTPTKAKRTLAHRQSTSPDSARKAPPFRLLGSAIAARPSLAQSSVATPRAMVCDPDVPPPLPPKPRHEHHAHAHAHADPHAHRRRASHTTHESIHATSARVHAASSQVLPEQGDSSPSNLFPHDGLVKNIHRFMRYSSAAYGQNFLRILGLGNSEFVFPSTGKHHANSWAFAQHTKIPIDAILLSSSTGSSQGLSYEKAPPLVHYITVEHKLKTIVLTCRGTLGLSDVLVDLTCDYKAIEVDGGDADAAYLVHSGMHASAVQLTAKSSTVHRTLAESLARWPDYGLVLCGHSLGGGVAALLAIISSTPAQTFVRQNRARATPFTHPPITTPFVTSITSGLPPGRPVHCYAYGPPAVASADLARHASGLITSVVQNADVVPTLSLGLLRDLRNIAITLSEEGTVAEEIVGRVVGINRRRFAFQASAPTAATSVAVPEPSDEDMLNDWLVSLVKTMRADMDNDKLYPPGMVYILEHFDVFVTDTEEALGAGGRGKRITHRAAQRVILRQCDSVTERFREPLFSKTMLNDHLPSHYECSTQLLYEGLAHDKL
ncbi:hypothetical protein Q5752_006658 [Cryptotrichosporon argae]